MIALKSQFMSNLLKILLGALLVLGLLELLGAVVGFIDVDFFAEKLYTPYSIVEIMGIVLYYIIVVIYLVWIYRVHMDLGLLFPGFSRSPRRALAELLVPIYNLYGVPAVYREIGSQFADEGGELQKAGKWIRRLAVPLILLIMAMNVFNRYIQAADELGFGVLVANSVVSCLSYAVFLALVLFIAGAMRATAAAQDGERAAKEQSSLTEPAALNV